MARHPAGGDSCKPPKFAARNRFLTLAVCGFLLLAIGLVFGQTVRHQFVNYDDATYVTENRNIFRGLSVSGLTWVFTNSHGSNWHPLTGLSHMLDCQVYGLDAGGHHLTNLLLHAATAVLLFLVLRRMTERFWPSALVAALFAVHPLHVESVAWVSERKDVLSGLFFVLILIAYTSYARRRFSFVRYLVVAVLFGLGLMVKPMLVTLPLLLLLLDYWPLGRMAAGQNGSRWRLVLEKLPLLLLVVISCWLTVWAQGDAVASSKLISFPSRIANALVAYVAYLGQLFYPVGLAAFYPHPQTELPIWKAVAALAVLAIISAVAIVYWRRRPYLVVGWLWYVGTLVPVIGLVQVGSQAMADRYTYLTQIGLYIALAWAAADVCRSWRYRRWICGIASGLLLAVLMGCAWRQTTFWRDSETLWNRAIACTPPNCVAEKSLGTALHMGGRYDEAIIQYRKALEIEPRFAEAWNNLGCALMALGRFDEAAEQFKQALKFMPDYADAHNNLGRILVRQGRPDEAAFHFRKALKINPDHASAYESLGKILASQGQLDEAIACYQKAVELKFNNADAHVNLGNALVGRGRLDEAMVHYQRAVELQPDNADAHCNLGVVLAACGQLEDAVTHYQRALEIQPLHAEAHGNLGIALVGLGRHDEAIAHHQEALRIKPGYAKAHFNLANSLAADGKYHQAVAHYRESLKIRPDYAEAHNNLARLLATCPDAALRSGLEAIEHARRANQLCGGRRPEILDTLAAAYAEAGRFPEALAAAHQAMKLATEQNRRALADAVRSHMALYEGGKPCRQASPSK